MVLKALIGVREFPPYFLHYSNLFLSMNDCTHQRGGYWIGQQSIHRPHFVTMFSYSLKGGAEVFGHSIITEVVATVSRHLFHLPLASAILCQLPEFHLLWEESVESLSADTISTVKWESLLWKHYGECLLEMCFHLSLQTGRCVLIPSPAGFFSRFLAMTGVGGVAVEAVSAWQGNTHTHTYLLFLYIYFLTALVRGS